MASQKLTDKSALIQQPAKDDLLMVVDTSDTTGSASGTSKKIQAENVIAIKSVGLTSAQIQALHTTPVELIAAPGLGKTIFVHSVLFSNTYVSVTETVRRAGIIAYGTPSGSWGSQNEIFRMEAWMRSVTADEARYAGPGFASTSSSANQPIKIATDGAITGNFLSTISISYTIIS